MKRAVCLMLAAVLCCLLLAGCGGGAEKPAASGTEVSEEARENEDSDQGIGAVGEFHPRTVFHNEAEVKYSDFEPLLQEALKAMNVTEDPQNVQLHCLPDSSYLNIHIGFQISGHPLLA